jgi:hypothetical protein
MSESPEFVVNEIQPDSNANAPPGRLDASNGPDSAAESEIDRIRRLTEQVLATAGAAGAAAVNAIMSPFEESEGSKMVDNLTADEKLPEKIQDQPQRIARAEAAFAADKVVNQLTRSFPDVLNIPVIGPVLEVALPWAPVALLKPERQRNGIMGLVSDPRAMSLAAVTGLAVAQSAKSGVPFRRFEINSYRDRLAAGTSQVFKTNASNRRPVKWASSDETKATVDPDTGEVKGVAPGPVTIIARAAGFEDKIGLTIE